MTMGSGGANSICRRRGISVNFIRGTSKIWEANGNSGQVGRDTHTCTHDLLEVFVIVNVLSFLGVLQAITLWRVWPMKHTEHVLIQTRP